MHRQVQFSSSNPILPPKNPGGTFRVKVQTAYLGDADEVFPAINGNPFRFIVDTEEYSAVLNQDLSAPFRIIPWENPVMEIIIEVYTNSYDRLIRGKNLFITNELPEN